MGPKILLLLCFAVAFRPGYCEPKSSGDEQRARLPEFLTELDLASLEASEEDIEALKTVVKRLAPEKNGEYQVYQGVMGQPGVDFPALTTIPPTSFSCRGSKGGYYADLETNCQVFHICDNGRKISFLCPNGTIFQQSQLICDWWFKVDCSKSTELYEQSSEQLVEEERKRSDAKRMNSEFHRSSSEIDDSSGQNYYQSGNSNYDGRQNGRTNPYGQTFNKNQIPGSVDQRGINDDTKSSIKPFDPSQIFVSNGPINNQFDQINELAASNVNKVSQDANGNSGPNNDNYNVRQQQQIQPSSSRSSSDRGNYRTVDRQQNQLVEGANREEKRQFNYEQRGTGKFTGSNQNSYQNQQQQQQEQQHSGRSNQQSLDYSSSNRKGASDRRNFSKGSSVSSTVASSDYELSSNRVTPSYTETTTFRTSTPSPIREYQQLAESAAFVSNRGNRFNDAYSSSQFNNYYNLNNNGNNDSNGNNGNNGNNNNSNNNNVKSRIQQKPTEKPRQKSITPTPGSDKITGSFVRIRSGSATSPFPTFQPFYKPRTSNNYPSTGYETTSYGPTTTDAITTTNSPYTNTEYYTQSYQDKTTYNDNFDYTTTTSYPTNQDYQTTTEYPNTDSYTEDYLRNSVTPNNYQTTITNSDYFENTTPTIITSGSYVNAKSYTNGKTISTNVNYKISGNSAFTTLKPYYKSQEYRQNSVATPEPIKPSTVRRSDSSSHYVTTPATYRDVTIDQNVVSAKNADNRVSNNQKSRALINNPPKANTPSSYRALENSIATSTEKNSRLQTGAFQQNGSTGKTLSPYDTSITYQHGKVMSTLGPYVPFTKNYAYSTTTTTTTAKPPAYTATVPTYSSTVSAYRATGAKSLGPKVRVSSLAPPRSTSRFRSGYLPEKKSDPSNYLTKKHNLNERPTNEREHAISMLQSLRGLEGTVPSLLSVTNSTRSGLNIPASSGPSTLHSLALYFATASDNYNSPAESRTNTAAKSDTSGRISARVRQGNTSYELPKTILTQHTINSYAELFNLNNAVEGNSSVENIFDQAESGEDSDDLDIQQSEGPIAGARKSNNTKLRELAQVFTHALSAYLQDPDTFKKILTEIRPTEPSTINDDDATFTATTLVPTTSEDYPSVTKEKDEVLDFSDDTTPPRPRRPTTVYPTTTDDPIITTDGFTQDYYTTGGDYYTTAVGGDQSGPDNNFAFQVNHAFGNTGNTGNELNSGTGSGLYYPEEATGPSGPSAFDDAVNNDGLNDYADNYFPTNYKKGNSKIGGFQNNTSTPKTYEPYGKYVKPDDATPIGDNYVASSTPASYVQPYQPEVSKDEEDKNQRYNSVTNNFNPTTYFPQRDVENSQNSITSFNGIKPSISQSQKIITDRKSPTTKPFRIRYYDPTTSKPYSNNRESLATAETDYSTYRDNYNGFTDTNNGITERPTVVTVVTSRTAEPTTYTETGTFNTVTNNAEPTTTGFRGNYNQNNDGKFSDHWTSSPAVTQLWESTVFVDPKRINQGLVSSSGEFGTTTIDPRTVDLTDTTERIPSLAPQDNILHQRRENLVTDSSHSGLSSRNTNNNFNYPSSPWQWADGSGSSTVNNRGVRNENDSPTAFTLLPQTYTAMKQNIATATAAPMYTTRSSITTTITSSVTSTSSGASSNGGLPIRQDNVLIPSGIVQPKSSNRPKHGASTIGDSINDKDNEISMAHNMFGKLNSTSTNILMRVMKQADKDVTVRQLVLLLINHCNGPMNKTMEEEKEQLLDALLRMPVNEFTSEESRDLVAGINRINLPIGRSDSHGVKRSTTTTTIPSTTSTTEEPNVTTFRSKKSRKVKSNTEEASTTKSGKNGEVIGKEETNNRISIENNADSDARALELLRSLYTIAAKWG